MQWKKERAEMPTEASLKEQKVDLERAQRAKELDVRAHTS